MEIFDEGGHSEILLLHEGDGWNWMI
jgi:hypothetical protein